VNLPNEVLKAYSTQGKEKYFFGPNLKWENLRPKVKSGKIFFTWSENLNGEKIHVRSSINKCKTILMAMRIFSGTVSHLWFWS